MDDDEALRAHLGAVHDLEDDPGMITTTALVEQRRVPVVDAPVTPEAFAGFDAAVVPRLRVYEPDADDAKWRPIVIGLGGILLLIFTIVATSLPN